jgi:hypothetical protein
MSTLSDLALAVGVIAGVRSRNSIRPLTSSPHADVGEIVKLLEVVLIDSPLE